jgi:trk system potassium uptake protein
VTSTAIDVDVRVALGVVGQVLKWFAIAFLAPAAVALGSGESPVPFVVSGAGAAAVGLALERLTADRPPLRAREGFLVVAALWLLVPAFGALPFLVGGITQLDHPLDAYFESMSGFTATGATVLTDVDALEHGMLFWRQLTHWLGGMGIVVLAVAVLPGLRVGGREPMRFELPGPSDVDSLGATVRDTARRLWKVYVGLSAAGFLLLAALGWLGLDRQMDVFDAFSYATSAVALGGFTPHAESARGLMPVTQWLLCGLMVVSGVNFLRLYRLFVLRRVRAAVRDDETRLYLALVAVATAILAVELLPGGTEHGLGGMRHAAFQAVSVMTTTGLASADWTSWGTLATFTLFLLMFVGACAGSPSGSIKVLRHLILFRFARRELEQSVHPDAVLPVRVSRRTVENPMLRSVLAFVVLYLLAFVVGTLVLALDARATGHRLGVFDALGAAATCLGNVGPAFGNHGPFGSYAALSGVSKATLSALMFLGRIEIVPFAVLLSRSYWRT